MHELKTTIRFATINDAELVLAFIKELAEYEKILHEVTATLEDIKQQMFGVKPCCEVLLLYIENKPAGIAIIYQNFSTFLCKPGIYIDDLFIKPEFRGQGHGTLLFDYILNLAKTRNCGRVEWAVLDWNKSAMQFYESKGAKSVNDWKIYRITEEVLETAYCHQ